MLFWGDGDLRHHARRLTFKLLSYTAQDEYALPGAAQDYGCCSCGGVGHVTRGSVRTLATYRDGQPGYPAGTRARRAAASHRSSPA